ncbi:uncharacterized protein LOC131257658 isoform X2 [Magnolia sinica]|nr:uncharacterized protein LOC131257658 isoform X2 [Magnolia sinica]XP_058114437.1 uncharacterized protein LOC131257658 isoform X2 [Magnolia sinica]
MGGAKNGSNVMDLYKKRRTVTSVWRPVSTQSSSSEGHSEKDAKADEAVDCNMKSDVGIQAEALHCKASTCSSDVQNSSWNTEPTIEQAGPSTLSSSELQCSDQSETVEEKTFIMSAHVVAENLSQNQHNAIEPKSGETMTIYQEHVKGDDRAGKHSISIEVDASLIRFIKGKGGSTQMQIEEEVGVKIIFPSSKEENSIVIEGTSIENVTKASEKIQVVLDEAIKSPKLDYSHFISLPLAIHPGLVEKLNAFQNSILGNPESSQDANLDSDSNEDSSDNREDRDKQLAGGLSVSVNLKVQDDNEHVKVKINDIIATSYAPKAPRSPVLSDSGIDRSIFTKPKTFHLTVLMLKLWNEERVAAATEVLQSISSKVKDALGGQPVSIRLKGLECMRGSLAKARVLYAPVEEIGGEDRLLRACQVIIDAYIEAGLVLEKDAHQKLKLHATLMNARHRKGKKMTRRYDSFDARGIFKQHGSEEWGEYLIHEAHLSQRFVFDDNGYYHCCASIPFPEEI